MTEEEKLAEEYAIENWEWYEAGQKDYEALKQAFLTGLKAGKNKVLIFPLKKQWYEKIKSGEKTIEYREVKPYWTKRIYKYKCWYSQFIAPKDRENFIKSEITLFKNSFYPATCLLRLGYTAFMMEAVITKIEIIDGKDTDLHIDKPVYAIHLEDVKEIK